METRLTAQMMEALAEPFLVEAIQWKPGSTTKDKSRGLALAYVDSRHYQDRLNAVCGADWSDSYQVTSMGNKVVVVCQLTLFGTTRSDVGECDLSDPNAITTAKAQSFKRSSTAFGLGAYLYRLPRMWVDYDPKRKRFTDAALAQLQSAVGGNATPTEPSGGNGSKPPATTTGNGGNGSVGPTEFWSAVKELNIEKPAAQRIAKGNGSWAEKLAALGG